MGVPHLWVQLLLGGLVIVITMALQSLAIGLASSLRPHVARRLGPLQVWVASGVISLAAIWMLSGMMIGVWVWAVILQWVGAFEALEPALYFALASYTTLGFGDVLPPTDWRIFGAMIGANGMIGFGLATAALVDFVSRLRDELSR